jgi:hypothetical protein
VQQLHHARADEGDAEREVLLGVTFVAVPV